MILSETELSYIAGLFDGEGCVCITKVRPNAKNREKNPRYHLVVEIANTYLPALTWIQTHFGGKLRYKGTKNQPCYALYWRKHAAANFLQSIHKFLRIKAQQVDIALEFMKYRDGVKKMRLRRNNEVVLSQYEDFRNTLREMHHVVQ